MPKKLVFELPGGRTVPVRKALKAGTTIIKALRARRARRTPSIKKLGRAVGKLKLQAQGSMQIDRQDIRWQPPYVPTAPGAAPQVRNQPTNLRPICWLHQAISRGAQIHSLEYNPLLAPTFATLEPNVVGTWNAQSYPITLPIAAGGFGCDPALLNRTDQLQYYDQAQGVQNKYTHTSTEYQFNITAKQVRGYLDIFQFHPKRVFTRSTAKDVSIPGGLPGFANLSIGVGPQQLYSTNNMYYSKKHLKRHYFNTTSDPGLPNQRFLQTNPDYVFSLTVRNDKSRSTIKATELFSGGVLDYTDIPLLKQDWIMVSCTLENVDVGPDNHIQVDIVRTPRWRDLLGASA